MNKLKNINDIVNKKFGKLTVLKFDHYDKNKRVNFYLCHCDCGKNILVRRNDLIKNHTKSCGCLKNHQIDTSIIGKRFGKLVVLNHDHYDNKRGVHYYKCLCDCGNFTVSQKHSLLNGRSKSCGCSRISHNMSNTRFYRIYKGILNRCYNKNYKEFYMYGGRGIKVCDRWLESFENFKDDMYKSYINHSEIYGENNTSIDRIDHNGNYCKENCRWATNKLQSNNTRSNRIIKYNNEELTLSQLIDKYADPHLNYSIVLHRLNSNWDVQKAITELPLNIKNKENNIIVPVIFHNKDRCPFIIKD